MPLPNPEALDFLLTRRSRPAKTLSAPIPDRAALDQILTVAARTPDHGKLEPWRFIVLEAPALKRLSTIVEERMLALGENTEKAAKASMTYAQAPLAVIVVGSPKSSEKIPQIEQVLSAGAACYGLLQAALAAGWGANWLSGAVSHDREFVEKDLSLAEHEFVAGIVHIGTEAATPPERPRPDLAKLTTWISE